MPNWGKITIVASVLSATACVSTDLAEAPAAPTAPTAAEIVRARQAGLHLSGAAMGSIRAAIVDREGDPKTQLYAARGLARWARALPTLFPEETRGVTPSRARLEIWPNKTDFEAKAAAYAAAAQNLADIAATGDRQAFIPAFQATAASCKACHDLYQAPAQPGT